MKMLTGAAASQKPQALTHTVIILFFFPATYDMMKFSYLSTQKVVVAKQLWGALGVLQRGVELVPSLLSGLVETADEK